jgi:hypothetical protein
LCPQNQIFKDPQGGAGKLNAWFSNEIDFNGKHTSRAIDDRLYEKAGPGEHTHLYDAVLDALERDDYCQFEVSVDLTLTLLDLT